MQATSSSNNDNAAAELGIMFDDDPFSPLDFQGAEIDGDELLEALSSHGGSIFDDIDVEEDADMIMANTDDTAITALPFTMNTCLQPKQSAGDVMGIDLGSFAVATFPEESPDSTQRTFRQASSINRYKPKNSRRKNRKKSTRDILSSPHDIQPLFLGEDSIRRRSDYDDMNEDDVSVSDVASACSAPADLMAFFGLYDDPAKAPDRESAMSMFMNPGTKQQQNMVDEETMRIRQRQQELLQEERQLQQAASSAQQRPRRRKTYDGTLPMMDEMRMNMMRGNGGGSIASGGSIESMVGENIMSSSDGIGNQNIQMKRRKSESCMMDMFGMEAALSMDQFGNGMANNLNQSSHSLDHLLGFPSNYPSATTGNLSTKRASELDIAVQEAQEKINHLKQLLHLQSQNSNGAMIGGGGEQQQQPQQEEQPAGKSWWASLQSELGTGPNLNDQAQDLGIPTKAAKQVTKKKITKKKKPEELAGPTEIPLPDKPDPEILKLDPRKIMAKLQESMARTSSSMKQLQEWDRANGLPKSHSQTMTNSNRSRNQLSEGVANLTKLSGVSAEPNDGTSTTTQQREKLSAMHAL